MKYYKKSKGSKYSAKQRSPNRYRLPYGTGGVYGGQDNAYKYYRHHPPIKPEKVSYEKLPKDEHQPTHNQNGITASNQVSLNTIRKQATKRYETLSRKLSRR